MRGRRPYFLGESFGGRDRDGERENVIAIHFDDMPITSIVIVFRNELCFHTLSASGPRVMLKVMR